MIAIFIRIQIKASTVEPFKTKIGLCFSSDSINMYLTIFLYKRFYAVNGIFSTRKFNLQFGDNSSNVSVCFHSDELYFFKYE